MSLERQAMALFCDDPETLVMKIETLFFVEKIIYSVVFETVAAYYCLCCSCILLSNSCSCSHIQCGALRGLAILLPGCGELAFDRRLVRNHSFIIVVAISFRKMCFKFIEILHLKKSNRFNYLKPNTAVCCVRRSIAYYRL